MKQNKNLSVAVLIDGDNASSEKIEDVMNFVARYGNAVVRRIYGDWTQNRFWVGKILQKNMGSGWYRLLPILRERTRLI